ncbi:sporulation protein YunB [Clostridia bacterium]|nr:sporulation protein YunB [Clostridia bacterium]
MFRFNPNRFRISKLKRILIVLLALVCTSVFYIELQIRPKIVDLTRIKADTIATESINKAVLEELDKMKVTYTDLMTIEYKDDKSISGISTNMVEMNKLKSAVTIAAQEKVAELNPKEICFKTGDLSGFDLMSGRGPDIIIKLYFSGSIKSEFKSSFISAGVNQTRHTIEVEVTATIYVTSESILESTSIIKTNVPVAETVIVGDVPALYTGKNLFSSEN